MTPILDRRAFTASALAVAGCATAPAQVLVNLAQTQTTPDGAQLDTGADVAGRMTAPVRINGQGPFDFVVDTGANRTVISAELAAQLGLPSAGAADVHGIAGVEAADTVAIETFDIDAVRTRRLRAPVLSRGRLGAAGLLGVDVLRDRRVLLDFRDGRFSIAPSQTGERSGFNARRDATGSRAALSGGVEVPARQRSGQLVLIGADVAGRPVTAFLDSGAQSTVGNLALRKLVLGQPPDPKLVRYVTPLFSATGQVAQGEVAIMRLLKIGSLRIAGLQTVFADLHVFDLWDLTETPSLLIGVDVMTQFDAIALDFGRRVVTFYPKSATR